MHFWSSKTATYPICYQNTLAHCSILRPQKNLNFPSKREKLFWWRTMKMYDTNSFFSRQNSNSTKKKIQISTLISSFYFSYSPIGFSENLTAKKDFFLEIMLNFWRKQMTKKKLKWRYNWSERRWGRFCFGGWQFSNNFFFGWKNVRHFSITKRKLKSNLVLRRVKFWQFCHAMIRNGGKVNWMGNL